MYSVYSFCHMSLGDPLIKNSWIIESWCDLWLFPRLCSCWCLTCWGSNHHVIPPSSLSSLWRFHLEFGEVEPYSRDLALLLSVASGAERIIFGILTANAYAESRGTIAEHRSDWIYVFIHMSQWCLPVYHRLCWSQWFPNRCSSGLAHGSKLDAKTSSWVRCISFWDGFPPSKPTLHTSCI